jgi:hypothetical protein
VTVADSDPRPSAGRLCHDRRVWIALGLAGRPELWVRGWRALTNASDACPVARSCR